MSQRVHKFFANLLLFCCVASAAAAQPASPKELEFDNPGPEFRGKPFWSWNGDLKENELKRQIGVLKEMGMGGYFMHSRTGLRTEYLGNDWFKLINACADKGARINMESWLYDEDRWPSGTAGGLVTENPRFRLKFISLRTAPAESFQWQDNLVAAFAVDLQKDNSYQQCVRLAKDTPKSAYQGLTVLLFTIEEMEKESFYNGFTYADTLNREATDEYIRLTHAKYTAQCGDRLGKSIKGIFTDEPHRGAAFTGFGIENTNRLRMAPWTYDVPQQFQKRFGYDLVERLPELFLRKDGQAVSPVKWNYMEMLQSMFLENWAKPIQAWCHTNGMIFTGHALHEDALSCQAAMQGSLMRFYEIEDYPGVDVLSEGNRCYWIVKQVASTARQTGKKRILSELYGCTGWQFNFESHKYVGDWQALFGVNLRCHHLSWYTMGAEAKRDYPASISFQSAWAKDYPRVEDYFSRLNLMLAQGQPACDVLVVNPVESVWCQVGVGWGEGLGAKTEALREIERAYQDFFFWLTESHIDFDYGDEEMMSRLSRIERDDKGQPIFRVGKAAYRAVLVPKMTTMRSSTLRLLEEFRKAGGQVVVAGEAPAYLDAVKSPAVANFAAQALQTPWSRDAVVAGCQDVLRRPIAITDSKGGNLREVFCQIREDGDRLTVVAMNMNRKTAFNGALLRVKGAGQLTEWDCATGKRYAVPSKTVNGWTEWTADFPAIGEHVYVLSPSPSGLPFKPAFVEASRQPLSGPFAYKLSEPNVCVLDMASYQIDNGKWMPETEVLKIDRAVRGAFGLPLRSGSMIQPWFSKARDPKPQASGKLVMNFEFLVESPVSSAVKLGIERPDHFQITLNGRAISSKNVKGWWVDPAIETISIPAKYFVLGTNKLELAADFRKDMNIESLYLLGNFGVRLTGAQKTLGELPAKLLPSDAAIQGLPFYSGAITYRLPVPKNSQTQSLAIETPKFEAACIKIDSKTPQYISWQPYSMEIAKDAIHGDVVDLIVTLTRRNSFGPLHMVPKVAGMYGPDSFLTHDENWSQDYQLYPAGLLEPPILLLGEK